METFPLIIESPLSPQQPPTGKKSGRGIATIGEGGSWTIGSFVESISRNICHNYQTEAGCEIRKLDSAVQVFRNVGY